MQVIIINGSNNSGKDAFADFFAKHYENKCLNISTIDKVKDLSKKYFGWNGKKTEEARKFLSEMKRIWSEYNNGPFLDMVEQIKESQSKLEKKDKNGMIYFVHCREPQEIQKFKDEYGDKCSTVLLKREVRNEKKAIANNDSDMNVDNYEYDKIVHNNGNKMDLELEAVKFVEEIREILKTKKEKQSIKEETKK